MLTPIGSKVFVLPMYEPDQVGLIYIPEQAKSRANQGLVKYVGPDVTIVKPGDHVLFGGYDGTVIDLEGEGKMLALPEEFIKCIVHDDPTDVAGLYFKASDGSYFTATSEIALDLIAVALQDNALSRGRARAKIHPELEDSYITGDVR